MKNRSKHVLGLAPAVIGLIACKPEPDVSRMQGYSESTICGINPASDIVKPQLLALGVIEEEDDDERTLRVDVAVRDEHDEGEFVVLTDQPHLQKISGFYLLWDEKGEQTAWVNTLSYGSIFADPETSFACDDGTIVAQFKIDVLSASNSAFDDQYLLATAQCDLEVSSDSDKLGGCTGFVYDKCIYDGTPPNELSDVCEPSIEIVDAYTRWYFLT